MKRRMYAQGVVLCMLLNTLMASGSNEIALLLQAQAGAKNLDAQVSTNVLQALKSGVSAAQHLVNALVRQVPLQTTSPDVKTQSQARAIDQAKSNLNHVDQSQQNLYAKNILAQRWPYDATLDFSSFIKKMRIDDGVVLHNKTNEEVGMKITFETQSNTSQKEDIVTLKPGQFHIIDKDSARVLQAVALTGLPNGLYLNPKFTEDGFLQVNVDIKQDRLFIQQYHPFTFNSCAFTEQQINDPAISTEEKAFRRDFNGSVGYLDFAAKQEGSSLKAIDAQRNALYEKNNITRLLRSEPGLLDSTVIRIPLITHKIWVTSDSNPKNPALNYIRWLEQSIETNPTAAGWTHYFWVENKGKLPELTKMLENHPHIKLMELDSLDTTTFITGDLYKEAIKKSKFGKATDILRLELLKIFGGYYTDTDYELYQSLIPFSKAYDLVVGMEPMSVYLCNAFIGSCPNHPVITKCLEMIKRNFSDAPAYIKNAPDNGFKTIVQTGPVAFTLAFALAADQGDYRDIVFPPHVVYPALTEDYPKKQVITPDGKKPAKAIGGHYWRTAWMDPAFGSKG